MENFKFIGLTTMIVLGLSGCGGSDNSSSTAVGYLKDSNVSGVSYVSGWLSGVTNESGQFTYAKNETVTFTIGGVTIGSINGASINTDTIVYPTDLAGVDRNNTTDARVVNTLMFLQSIDSDNNATNGIDINSTIINSLQNHTLNLSDSNLLIEDINTSVKSLGKSLVAKTDAISHFRSTLQSDGVLPITHNGFTYKTMKGPKSGRIWLDRDLGALEPCAYENPFQLDHNSSCIGHYYQWGRAHDGHQETNSSISSTLANDMNDTNGSFITNTNFYADWTTEDANGSMRATNWSAIDGSSICPLGFRVPRENELVADADYVSNTFLNAVAMGFRIGHDGSRYTGGSVQLWSTTKSDEWNDSARSLYLSESLNGSFMRRHAYSTGLSVRCIQD